MYNLLTESMIRYDNSAGNRVEVSLPEVYEALMSDSVECLPCLAAPPTPCLAHLPGAVGRDGHTPRRRGRAPHRGHRLGRSDTRADARLPG